MDYEHLKLCTNDELFGAYRVILDILQKMNDGTLEFRVGFDESGILDVIDVAQIQNKAALIRLMLRERLEDVSVLGDSGEVMVGG